MDSELGPGPQGQHGDHAPDRAVHRVMEVTEPAVGPETVIHLAIKENYKEGETDQGQYLLIKLYWE